LRKLYLVKTAGSIRERLGGDPLAREKARQLSMELLDRGFYALVQAFS
jgi:hypothetical protein